MKQKDIAVIIVVAFVSGVFAYVISSKIIVTPANRQQAVEVVPSISDNFQQVDTNYFNSHAIDPTKLIQIGNNSNSAPFSNQ